LTTDDVKNSIKKQVEETNKWKVDYEDISTRKIQEIHAALKMLNANIKNVASELKEGRDVASTEIKIVEKNFVRQF
jgi:uncharacterized protein YdeI (YjbR/CyaY-like superfamily)